MRRAPYLPTAILLVALFLAASLRMPGFGSIGIAAGLFTDQAALGIVALGMTVVILTGGIDLSVGSAMALSGMLCVLLLEKTPLPDGVALAAPVVAGTLLGWLQGKLIVELRLPAFLVTLGGLFAFQGVATMVGEGSTQSSSPLLRSLSGWALDLPGGGSATVPSLLFVGLALASAAVLRQTLFGRTAMALGGGGAAEEMGLPVRRVGAGVYAISGGCAALGGVASLVFTGSGDPLSGIGRELEAIGAVVIGGTLLSGGRGSVLGTVLGTLTVGVIQAAIIYDGTLDPWWGRIAVAGLLGTFLLGQAAFGRKGYHGA